MISGALALLLLLARAQHHRCHLVAAVRWRLTATVRTDRPAVAAPNAGSVAPSFRRFVHRLRVSAARPTRGTAKRSPAPYTAPALSSAPLPPADCFLVRSRPSAKDFPQRCHSVDRSLACQLAPVAPLPFGHYRRPDRSPARAKQLVEKSFEPFLDASRYRLNLATSTGFTRYGADQQRVLARTITALAAAP